MHHKALACLALLAVTAGLASDGHAQQPRITHVVRRTGSHSPRSTIGAAVVHAARVIPAAAPSGQQYVHTLAQIGFPRGIGLDGSKDRQDATFRLPPLAPVSNAVLSLKLHFTGSLIPQSNVQVYANDIRLTAISRADADVHGEVSVELPVPTNLLSGGFVAVSFRSSMATTADRCLDDRLGLSHVDVDPQSKFSYSLPIDAVNTVETAIGVLPDTITFSLPSRRLTLFELWSAYTAATELGRLGHAIRYTQLPQIGDVTVGTADEIAAGTNVVTPPVAGANVAVFRYGTAASPHAGIAITGDTSGAGAAVLGQTWAPLANAASLSVHAARGTARGGSNDPTFADLRLQNLQQNLGAEATWRLGLDVRDLPVGRLPTHVDLRVATAPNTGRRQITVFVFWNGTLVRSADVSGDGLPQLIGVDVPSDLLATRNEIRVTMQRHVDAGEGCAQSDAPLPAQLLPSSRIVTSAVAASASAFDAVAAQIGDSSSLYLPADALDHPDRYLPTLVGIGRAFWIAPRVPRPIIYTSSAPPLPTKPFVLIGQPAGATIDGPLTVRAGRLTIHRKDTPDTLLDIADVSAWSMAEVVKWNGQAGVQLLPSAAAATMPSAPEAYGRANLLLVHDDSTTFPLSTDGVSGPLVINEGPTLWMRVRRDWILWAIFGGLVLIVLIVVGARAVMRRTPRREIRRPVAVRPPPRPPTAPGA